MGEAAEPLNIFGVNLSSGILPGPQLQEIRGLSGEALRRNPGLVKRYMRNPNVAYLSQALGGATLGYDDLRVCADYHFTINDNFPVINEDYLLAAATAIDYLTERISSAVYDPYCFEEVIRSYIDRSSYSIGTNPYVGKIEGSFRDRSYEKYSTVPHSLIDAFDSLLARIYTALDPEQNASILMLSENSRRASHLADRLSFSTRALEESLEKVRLASLSALQTNSLDAAIEALYEFELSWFVRRGNHSRSMNYFNVLLEKMGFQPISHGFIDFAAFCMTPEQFN